MSIKKKKESPYTTIQISHTDKTKLLSLAFEFKDYMAQLGEPVEELFYPAEMVHMAVKNLERTFNEDLKALHTIH